MTPIKRGYLQVGKRRVHYRRLGEGPPLVMLHGSPGDSAMLAEEMGAAASRFTCLALDTPGFGESDPLPGDVLTVADLAGATAEAMAALGLPPCRVYGTHTGAAIGAELGAGWPDRVSGLVLEGLPMFTPAETAALFEGYFAPMIPDPLGSHLTATWVRFRDQFTWFPWTSRHVSRLNPVDRPTPEEIDHWVSMFYRSCKTYGPAYKAACYYGEGAFRAASAIERPAVFMASAEDMLFPHLDRLPALRPGQRIERLAYNPSAKYEAIAGFAASLPGEPAVLAHPGPVFAGEGPSKAFIDTPDGQMLVRAYGDPAKPAVLLLHDGPGTGLAMDSLARSLAPMAQVIVPDLPGCGESTPPPAGRDVIDAAVDGLLALADALALDRFFVAGLGCGGAAAAALASRNDARLQSVLLERPAALDEAAAEQIAPDLPLSPEGSHWLKAWLMVRDGQIYQPWYDGRVAAQRRTQGNFDGDWLHDQVVALMAARASYFLFPRAALRFDSVAALSRTAARVAIAGVGGLGELIVSSLNDLGTHA
jgi:pimeloyl-ACP methyl ester carboxylesterase